VRFVFDKHSSCSKLVFHDFLGISVNFLHDLPLIAFKLIVVSLQKNVKIALDLLVLLWIHIFLVRNNNTNCWLLWMSELIQDQNDIKLSIRLQIDVGSTHMMLFCCKRNLWSSRMTVCLSTLSCCDFSTGDVNPNKEISRLGMIYLFSPHIFTNEPNLLTYHARGC